MSWSYSSRVNSPGGENCGRRRHVVPGMKPISEVHVAEPGLAVVEVAACNDETAFAVQELLAGRSRPRGARAGPRRGRVPIGPSAPDGSGGRPAPKCPCTPTS
ncbi:DUF6207 family protein [Streptomyces sp. NPDC001356]